MSEQDAAFKNTDRELWRKVPGDYYSPRIFITQGEGIGIEVGGYCLVFPVEGWHCLGKDIEGLRAKVSAFERALADAHERIAELEQTNFDMWMAGRENEKS